MLSREVIYVPKNVRRSRSESIQKNENKYESFKPERITRRSETSNDNHELEDIVTCSIHLGIMEDPKKMFCQHAFCYKCLKEYSKTCVDLICPICRVKERISDVDKLPSALTEKQLIDVVMKHRINKCVNESLKTETLSDERKEELVRHLLKEINSNNGIYKVSTIDDEFIGENYNVTDQITACFENNRSDSVEGLTYDMMDIETIRENMLKHSQYQVVKRDAIQKIYKNLYQNKTDNFHLDFSIFDINITSNHPKLNQLVLVDSVTSQILVYSDSNVQIFHIYLNKKIVKPNYIRIYRGNLLLTGILVNDNNNKMSVFLQCNFCGEIFRQSDLYLWSNDFSDLPMMMGFDVNEKEEKYYLCMPKTGNVRIYNSDFIESPQHYEFDDNRPEYIAFCASKNQLWISCPQNKRILILDIDSGIFRLFNTEQINKAIPKMIFVTDDEKIIFLDTKGNRFIWIKRRNEYILTQKLNIPSMNRDLKIKTFQVLPFSMIIVGIDNEIFVFQSAKYFSRSRRIFELCSVL